MDVSLSFAGESLTPLACGALHWPAQSALIVADLHFEKASAFERRGRLLPPYDSHDTLGWLIDALEATGARRVFCLGDSFHDAGGPGRLPPGPRSALRALTTSLDWLWITGNHDDDAGAALGGRVMEQAQIGALVLRHQAVPGDPAPELSGHFHPKVAVMARGRRIVRRCFAVSPTKIILPAYGAFTGGLWIDDPAIAAAMPGPVVACVAEAGRLLRFPVQPHPIAAE
ncbi:MAG: ligase-associated DNA damage response endonuclease PdeM [Sandarakinorhabdus sp.]|nr:ligase-associated DNA damage response endonuclease PdeM [Sandarakinorhabdus sp.]